MVLLETMNRYGTLEQGKWRASETFEYRYELNADDGLFAFVARAHSNFYVAGFAVEDSASIASDEDADHWIAPSALLGMMDDPRFLLRGGSLRRGRRRRRRGHVHHKCRKLIVSLNYSDVL